VSLGPTGPVPLPPPDLALRPLPLTTCDAGFTMVRIHRTQHGPIHFSPGTGRSPAGRYDSTTGRFGVLYAAQEFAGAFVETVLREPNRTLIGLPDITARALSVLTINADIRLVDLTGPGLSRLGLDARLLSGPYGPTRAWSDAFQAHSDAPAGILYPSRFDPSQLCVGLFNRVARHIEAASDPVPLAEMLPEVSEILDRYGKALDPG
jgi:hypothetical protein